jgi:hypothetical protein
MLYRLITKLLGYDSMMFTSAEDRKGKMYRAYVFYKDDRAEIVRQSVIDGNLISIEDFPTKKEQNNGR